MHGLCQSRHDWPVLDALSAAGIARCHEFEGQDLAITAWSWAKLEARSKGLAAIGQVREQRLMSGRLMRVLLALRSHLQLDAGHGGQLGAAERGAMACPAPFGQVSNAVWAWAALRHRDPELMEAMAARAMQSRAPGPFRARGLGAREFISQELANSVGGLGWLSGPLFLDVFGGLGLCEAPLPPRTATGHGISRVHAAHGGCRGEPSRS